MKFGFTLSAICALIAAPRASGQQHQHPGGQQLLRAPGSIPRSDEGGERHGFDGPDGSNGGAATDDSDKAKEHSASFAGSNCFCGAGHCDQRGCTGMAICGAGHCDQRGLVGPTCGAGHCDQEGATNPTCNAGHCNQRDTANPSCNAGHCCQEGATGGTCNAGHCDCNKCIGGDTLLFSCTADKVVPAREVKVGDRVRAAKAEDGSSVCSDVYYVYRHEGKDLAVKITTSREESFTVSYDHIVYVGDSFEERRPVRSQDVALGDELVTATSDGDRVRVVAVEHTGMDLVNVLTLDPHLEIQGGGGSGIVISAHSVDEDAYGTLFAPIRYVYLTFGATAVEYMNPLFTGIDYAFASTGIRVLNMMAASIDE